MGGSTCAPARGDPANVQPDREPDQQGRSHN